MTLTRPRVDLYTFVHKGLRRKLFASSMLAGTADPENDSSWKALRTSLEDLLRSLRAHAAHEEKFIHPLLRDRLPTDAKRLEADHAEAEDALAALFEDPRLLYLSLNRFISLYLPHLDREELLMPRIRERASEDEIRGIMKAFQASRTPAEGLEDLKLIIPALTLAERSGILEGIREQAPSDVYKGVCGAVAAILDPSSWSELRMRLGLA